MLLTAKIDNPEWSPPTRAEWIEMDPERFKREIQESPPTRAEWIEICGYVQRTA
mgnify:CR=1 FL=1